MKVYFPRNWKRMNKTFTIVVDYQFGETTTDDMKNVLQSIYGKKTKLDYIVLTITVSELLRRFDKLDFISGTTSTGSLYNIKTQISAEKLYQLIHWEECSQEMKKIIQQRLNPIKKSLNFIQRILRSA